MDFTEDKLTWDKFLDGQLMIRQPSNGYRAGVDPVFLAATVVAKPGQSVLELGCGVGVASLCLERRVGGLNLAGIEVQPEYAALARRNAKENGITFDVLEADIKSIPMPVRDAVYDHVILNPPYFLRAKGTSSDNLGRDIAIAGATPIGDWIDVATRRLRHWGYLTIIQNAERLQDVISAMDGRLGGVTVQPLSPRIGRDAELVIVQARKGGRGIFRLLAPIILHEGASHIADGDSYTPDIRRVLRDGAALKFNG